MSRIYFHNLDTDDLELHGSERAYMARLIDDISLALLAPSMNEEIIKRHLPETSDLHRYDDACFVDCFTTWFHVSDDKFINPIADRWEMSLNTAYKFGNDQIKLITRLHAQCEIYCYISPKNFKWLAELIKNGLGLGIYRKNHGWEGIYSYLLHYMGTKHIVCSYSVCDQFPSRHLVDYDDTFYDLPHEKQWGICIDKLLENKWLEIKPDNWDDYYFGKNYTVFDLLNIETVEEREWKRTDLANG